MFKRFHAPPALILSSISLLIFGLVMITSASFNITQTTFCVPLHYFWQQFAYATIGISLAILIITYVPMRICQHFNMHLLLLSLCLFSYLLHFPVVEPMKLLIILYVANYLSHDPLNGLIKPIIILCLVSCILLIDPNYGTFVVLFTIILGMLFLARIPIFQFISWIMALCIIMLLLSHITTFTIPWINPFKNSITNLPDAHINFLFAIIAKELGLMGIMLVIGLFTLLIYQIILIGICTKHQGCSFLANGIALYFGIQTTVGILGLNLPLMSYGASSLIVTCIMLALILRINYETHIFNESTTRRRELLKLSKL